MSKNRERIEVPKQVYNELMEIRDTGVINMFDYQGVMSIANEKGMFHTVTWMYDNRDKYMEGVMKGISPEGEVSRQYNKLIEGKEE